MKYLKQIDANNQIVFTDRRGQAYAIEYESNAWLFCRLLQLVYKGTEFTVEPEMEDRSTAMFFICCEKRQLRLSKIRNLFR